jgi:endonuclease/exonuclease/phosphatase family metal-dependent hydrolase
MRSLRVVTLNLWNEQGPWVRRLERAASELCTLAPDVVALQEVRTAPGRVPNQAQWLADRLSAASDPPRRFEMVYRITVPWDGGEEGLALLTWLPVRAEHHTELPFATEKDRRIGLGARLAVPLDDGTEMPVLVFTTHLTYRLQDGLARQAQAEHLDNFVAAQRADPAAAGGVTILLGDLNASPRADEIRFLRGEHALAGRTTYWQDAFAVRYPHEALTGGFTWSSRNPYVVPWLEPDRRLDYVLVSPMARDGRGKVLESRIVLCEPGPDGVYPSDHFGVMADIQLRE